MCRLTCLIALLLLAPVVNANDVLHEERSLYSQIVVKRIGPLLCLQFSIRRDQRNQSCVNSKRPKEMVFTYTRMTMTSVLFTTDPQRVLIIGLGGGTLPTAYRDLFPNAVVDAVEIDPAVVSVAKRFFNFAEDERLKVHTQDARVFTKRAGIRGQRYDVIVLDAFNGEYIPEHLMTQEYLEETRDLLTDKGVLVANTFAISDLYDHESTTYTEVFGEFINFQVAESANRIIVVPKEQVSDDELKRRASAWRDRLKPYDVPIRRFARQLISDRKRKPNWDTTARLLTDQYSPANLLQGQ